MIGGSLITTEVDLSAAPAFTAASAETFQLPPLYRLGGDGKIWVWVISFDGENLVSCWETLNNFQQGLIQSSTRRVETNSRSASLYSQALQEAQHEHKNKKDKQGYGEQLVQHDIFSMPAMLCHEWKPTSRQIVRWPVWVMPKLDGGRCRIHTMSLENTATTKDVHLISRGTQVVHNLSAIREEFLRFARVATSIISEKCPTASPLFRLDGELYSKNLTFDQISGVMRLKNSVSPVEHLVQYFMFDLILTFDATYDQRYFLLLEIYQKHVAIQGGPRYIYILDAGVANTPNDVLSAHEEYVKMGFEGVIIRRVGGRNQSEQAESYHRGVRCTAMYKYKSFQDDEGYIIGAEPGKGTEENAVVWQIQDKQGNRFSCRPRGDIIGRRAYYEQFVKDPQQFIGKEYRYRFQSLTPDGNPRFPVGLGFPADR